MSEQKLRNNTFFRLLMGMTAGGLLSVPLMLSTQPTGVLGVVMLNVACVSLVVSCVLVAYLLPGRDA